MSGRNGTPGNPGKDTFLPLEPLDTEPKNAHETCQQGSNYKVYQECERHCFCVKGQVKACNENILFRRETYPSVRGKPGSHEMF